MKKLLLGFMFICTCATTYAYPSGIDVSKQQGTEPPTTKVAGF